MLRNRTLVFPIAGLVALCLPVLSGVGFAQSVKSVTGAPVAVPESSVSSASKTIFADLRVVGRGLEVLVPGECPDVSCPSADACFCAIWSDTKVKAKFNGNLFKDATLDTQLLIDATQFSDYGEAGCFNSSGVATIFLNANDTKQVYLNLTGQTCFHNLGQWFLTFHGDYSVTGGTKLFSYAFGTGSVRALTSNSLGVSWTRLPIDIRGTMVK